MVELDSKMFSQRTADINAQGFVKGGCYHTIEQLYCVISMMSTSYTVVLSAHFYYPEIVFSKFQHYSVNIG